MLVQIHQITLFVSENGRHEKHRIYECLETETHFVCPQFRILKSELNHITLTTGLISKQSSFPYIKHSVYCLAKDQKKNKKLIQELLNQRFKEIRIAYLEFMNNVKQPKDE